jgi:hypothetical protein
MWGGGLIRAFLVQLGANKQILIASKSVAKATTFLRVES